jgi:hypothetical protein
MCPRPEGRLFIVKDQSKLSTPLLKQTDFRFPATPVYPAFTNSGVILFQAVSPLFHTLMKHATASSH